MTAEDARLRRAREGDLAAFNELVLEFEGPVFNLCLRMLGQRQAAEDAAQEAFIAAWRHISTLRGESFRPWMLRIAANLCRDELRRRGRRPAVSLESALEAGVPEPAEAAAPPESVALNSELRGQIEAALRQLPEEQRLALVLADVQGLDYQEVAAVMRTSLGTVKSRIARGRARLRQLLTAAAELPPAGVRHGD